MGRINLLFSRFPPFEFVVKVCNCFGLDSPDDSRAFCESDTRRHDTVAKVHALYSEMKQYYVPCKARMFLGESGVSFSRSLVLLRHHVQIYGYLLTSSCSHSILADRRSYRLRKKDASEVAFMKTSVIAFD